MFDLFLPGRYRAFRDEGGLRANVGVLIPLSLKMKVNNLDSGLLTIIRKCETNLVAALWTFAQAHEIDSLDSAAIGWLLHDFGLAIIIAILE